MTCFYCGTELPPEAMFCGECGRPVAADGANGTSRARTAPAEGAPEPAPFALSEPEPERRAADTAEADPGAWADVGRLAEEQQEDGAGTAGEPEPQPSRAPAEPVDEFLDEPEPEAADVELCAQCGAPLAATDIFCPECGYVRHRSSPVARPHDTVVLDPFPWGLPRELVRAAAPSTEQSTSAEQSTGNEAAPNLEPAPSVAGPSSPEPVPSSAPVAAVPSAADLPVAVAPLFADHEDTERTRIVERGPKGERFVLQFSTGESVSVNGTGLIGRNPIAEPGEYFDTMVTIVDPGKSVSKTHLEFGQDGGSFWISDRFSGNGTLARQPESDPRRCDPGKRYRVVRGTRVDIGEQFFIVS